MQKTPQEFRRDNVKQVFDKILQSKQIKLSPLDISVKESWKSDFTFVDICIKETIDNEEENVHLVEEAAKGFVDGMFKACKKQYSNKHPSLNNIRLVDYQVVPKFKKKLKTMGTDAPTEITLMMDVADHGVSEFSCVSRSILYSSFAATLEAFQFYINCEKTFHKIQIILDDARRRNRGDIAQTCLTDLSKLTEVNTYEKNKN